MKDIIYEFLDYTSLEKKYSDYTETNYEEDLFKYNEYLQINNLNYLNVDYSKLSDFVIYLKKSGYKSTTINRILSALRSFYNYLENDPGCSNINMIASIYKSFIKKQIINPNTGKIYLSNMLSLAQIAYLFNRQINSMPFKDYQQQKATYLQEHQFKDKDGLIYNNDLFSEATSKKETLDAEDSAIINPDISASEMEYVNEAEEAFLDKHAYKHY